MNEEQIARLKVLRSIRQALKSRRAGVSGPDAWKGWLAGIVIAAVGFGVSSLLPSPFPGAGLVLPGAIVAGVLVGLWINRRGRTWGLAIYDELAAYQPVNGPAYRSLQETVKDGGFDADAVLEWTYIEQAAIRPPVPSKTDLAREKFLTASPEERAEDEARGRFETANARGRGERQENTKR